MRIIVALGGLGLIMIGSFLAAMSDVFPTYRRRMHGGGGGLLIGGVALLGCALPLI